MLKNAYLLAKIGADTAENEQHFAEILPIGRRVADRCRDRRGEAPAAAAAEQLPGRARAVGERVAVRRLDYEKFCSSKFCKFLAGLFSAVSKRNFARKYAFDSIFQFLQDLHPFAPLQSQIFRKKSV